VATGLNKSCPFLKFYIYDNGDGKTGELMCMYQAYDDVPYAYSYDVDDTLWNSEMPRQQQQQQRSRVRRDTRDDSSITETSKTDNIVVDDDDDVSFYDDSDYYNTVYDDDYQFYTRQAQYDKVKPIVVIVIVVISRNLICHTVKLLFSKLAAY